MLKRELTRRLDLGNLIKNGDGPQRKLKWPVKKVPTIKGRDAKPSKKSGGKTLYKRLPVPGSDKFVTIMSKDISKSVNIYYDKKMLKLKMSDIIKMTNMRTIPDMIKILKSYKLDM